MSRLNPLMTRRMNPLLQAAFLGRARLAQDSSQMQQLTPDQMAQLMAQQGQQQGQFPGASGMPPAATAQGQLAQNGAILQVQISSPNGGTPITIQAMIDTGASISTINTTVAQNASLQATGDTQLGGVGGTQDSTIYAASLTIPAYNITVPTVQVASVPGQLPAPADMLIGRDILENLVMNYDGSAGQITLTQGTAAPAPPDTSNQGTAAPPTPGTIAQPGAPVQGPLPQPPASSPIPWPWIGGGVAAAGLVVGGLFLFKVL